MKKFLKVAAVLSAALLLVGVGYFADMFLGNPISGWQARQLTKAHLEKNYKNTDYEIERIGYDFKMGDYVAYITSPTNIDGDFVVRIDNGKVEFDNYDRVVSSFSNTKRRLNEEYYHLLDGVLVGNSLFPYDVRSWAELLFEPLDGTTLPEDALLLGNLELNKLYDVKALGKNQGYLHVTVRGESATYERAAEILLEMKALCEQVGTPFYAVHFTIFEPNATSSDFYFRYFLYEDIYEEGLTERLQKSREETKAYWEQVFAEKEQKEKE